jgi:hypothetical protein
MERHPMAGLELRCAGAARGFELADLSNDGLSFYVEPDDDLDAFLPGTLLEEIALVRDGRVGLEGVTAMVRHVAVEPTMPSAPGLPAPVPRYRVGCEMRERPRELGPPRRTTYIKDFALAAGLVRAALRGGGVLIEPLEGERPGTFGTRGQVDLAARSFSLTGLAHDLTEHEVVRGQFELGGNIYRFTSSVIARLPLTLRLPATIEVCQDRASGRYRPSVTSPVLVELDSVLQSGSTKREVRDVSSTGLSLEIDPLIDLFPPGMHFNLVRMTIGGETFSCRGRVRNLSRIGGRELGLRCGIELLDLDEPTRVRLADVIMRARYPGLQDGCRVGFEDLWRFFQETAFVYPAKQTALDPLMPEIRGTFEALGRRPTDLFKSVLAADGAKLIGHVSGLRAYRRTWMSQHLAGLNGRRAGALLNLGQAEYFGQNPDLEYFKIFFRPDNKWPARVFGGFARTVADPRLSDLRTYDYYQLPKGWTPTSSGEGRVEVMEAAGPDLSIVERHFVRTERGVLLRADDLTRDVLGLAELNARYRELGLQRRRRVLLAFRRNTPIAFCLLEQSSPGLNLSELLSAFRIYILDDAGSDALAARAALTRAVMQLMAQAGRPAAVGLGLAPERSAYAALGAVATKQYSCWTCHRLLYQRFSDHVDRIVKTLAARAKRHSSTGEDAAS